MFTYRITIEELAGRCEFPIVVNILLMEMLLLPDCCRRTNSLYSNSYTVLSSCRSILQRVEYNTT